ncbi:MAG: hypothetical protein GY925_23415 [Actinomycetia bacterium]|nr:hypothetical protein [Actinomycetes bacterium]
MQDGHVTLAGQTAGGAHRPASVFQAAESAQAYLEQAQRASWSPDHSILRLLRRQGQSTVGDLIEGSNDDPHLTTLTRRVITRSLRAMLEPDEGGPLVVTSREVRREAGRPAAKLYQISSEGLIALEAADCAATQLVAAQHGRSDRP